MQFPCFWIITKGTDWSGCRSKSRWQQTIFFVMFLPATNKIAGCRPESRRQPSTFSIRLSSGEKMSCGSSPWGTATTLNFFYPAFLLGTRMSCGSLPWGTATTLNFFYPPFFWGQGWAAGRRLEAGRRPSPFFYLEKVCSLAGIWTPDVLTTGRGSYH